LATAGAVDPTAEGRDVVVVYTRLSAESKSVADYYASKRGVPAEQVIGLAVPPGENITRSDYERLVQEELIRQLRDRNLTEFNAEISPSRPGRPGRVFYRATSSKVRYIALCWGMPYRIQHDAAYDPNHLEEVYRSLPAHLQRDEGSLDGELSLLPIAGRTTAWGPVRNPLYGNTNLTLIQPTNGVFMVTRLDGPTPDIAKRLVDKALTAERDGLNGRAYFDLRSITSGAYATGDHWITNAASVARRHGYETVVDLSPETFPVNQPFPQVALYAGWYAGTFDGPFRLPVVEFMPGAIAYHLHSFSAFWVRSPEHNWVGPLLAKGAAVTLGCIEEPYLELTPNIGIFFERLADQRGSVGEAAVACQAVFSWQTVVVGDPLYRPFKRSFLELESVHEKDGNPALEWDVWRKANDALQRKQSPESVIRDLVAHPLATQSAILAEKIARLHHATGQDRSAIEWGQRSIQAGGSPQQRAQLLRWIAGWQTKPDPKGALATLESFVREFPGHPDILHVLEQELELAQSLRKTADVRRIKSAIQALHAPATNSPPVAPTK
jgi:uncharacterized protein (TIGR03790 family)